MRGLLIPVARAKPIIPVDIPDNETGTSRLQAMRNLIGGGWLEPVHTQLLMDTIDRAQSPYLYRLVMMVDEEGAGHLPINSRASLLYAPGKVHIYGPVIILGEYRDPMEGDDITTLPDYYTANYLTAHLNVLSGE